MPTQATSKLTHTVSNRRSTTFFGHMVGCWILIGLKTCVMGSQHGVTFWLAYSSHVDKPIMPWYVPSETINDCNSIALHVFFHLYGRSGRKAIYHSRVVCYGLIKPLFLWFFLHEPQSLMVNSWLLQLCVCRLLLPCQLSCVLARLFVAVFPEASPAAQCACPLKLLE